MRFQIPNGYAPIVRPDGKRIACGFNEVIDVDVPHALWATEMAQASSAGFHNDKICKSQYVVMANGQYGRHLIDGPMPVPDHTLPGVNPSRGVINGMVVSSAGGSHYINGRQVAPPTVEIIPGAYDPFFSDINYFDGTHYGYKPHQGTVWPFVVRNVNTLAVALTITDPISNEVIWTDPEGRPWVFANLYGSAVLYNPAGVRFWTFQPGEFASSLSLGPNGEMWVWTVGQFNADGRPPFICGRPKSALTGPGIVLRGMWWASLVTEWQTEGRWLVAGFNNNGTGLLDVDDAVDPDQPREMLDLSKPLPPEQPPSTEPPSSDVVVEVPASTVKAGTRIVISFT